MKKTHGGARRNAGRKKGGKNQWTLEKAILREETRKLILEKWGEILMANVQNAIGLRHTFMRDKSGKFTMLTDPKDIETALNSGTEGTHYWTYTKDPNVEAFKHIADRLLDRTKEQELDLGLKGTVVFTWRESE